jgi:cobalt/nickel transport system permease protein
MLTPASARLSTGVHRLSTPIKLTAAGTLLVVVAAMPRRPDAWYLVVAALLVVLAIWSRLGWRFVLPRLLVVEPIIVGVAILALLEPATAPAAWAAIIKSHLAVLTVLTLAWTTPASALLAALRRAGLPAELLTTAALMLRYLPVLVDESRRMQRARSSRTIGRGRGLTRHALTTLVARLFVRATRRAERIYLAMCARGWQ